MKYVVVGGAGFIGSNLVDRLVDEKNEVVIIDNFSTGKEENINENSQVFRIDISDTSKSKEITDIMKNTDTVFLLAAKARVQPSIVNPIQYEVNNTIGTLNILKCAVDAGVRRLVYSASSSAYGDSDILPLHEGLPIDPLSPYGAKVLW